MRPARLAGWIAFALALALPLAFGGQGFALTLAAQASIAVVMALSFNVLWGQAGMLSFGHAIFSGLGAYAAAHALLGLAPAPGWAVALLPLAGGAGGLLAAAVFGYVMTRRSGVAFAMISLALAELVAAGAQMLPRWSGGEAGISVNRAAAEPLLGWSFAAAHEVYGLIAVWTLASSVALFAFTATPLGRLANAVRDNAERLAFQGYDPRNVRYRVCLVSGFFAGIAGALACLSQEIVSPESVSLWRSAEPLFAAVLGGAGSFFGPALGAVVVTFMSAGLPAATQGAPFYLGLLFVAVILGAPRGLAGTRLSRTMFEPRRWAIALPALTGTVLAVELAYHRSTEGGTRSAFSLLGVPLDAAMALPWVAAAALLGLAWAIHAWDRRA